MVCCLFKVFVRHTLCHYIFSSLVNDKNSFKAKILNSLKKEKKKRKKRTLDIYFSLLDSPFSFFEKKDNGSGNNKTR